jgi:flagellar hook-associated protein 3 FlgL
MEALQALTHIQQAYSRRFDVQGQLGTGRRIQRPSDDPTGAARILDYARRMEELEQDRRNILAGKSALESAAGDLQAIADVFHTARERVVQGVSGTLDADDRAAIAGEMDQLLAAILGFANSRDHSGYVFAGSRTDTQPFVRKTGPDGIERVVYAGDDRRNLVEVAPGITEAFNVPGRRLIDVGPRGATTFSGTTGVTSGGGSDSGTGRAKLVVAHTATLFGASPGAAVHLPSRVRAGASSAAQDTILGSSHSISLTVNASGSGTVSLDGGPQVAFTTASTDLAVTNAAGDVVHLDLSQAQPGFTGTVQLHGQGTFSLDGGQTTTPINFGAASQALINPADGSVTHVDATAIVRTGTSDVVYGGTLDLFNAVLFVRDLLRVRGTPQEEAAAVDEARKRLDDLDRGMDAILRAVSEVGAASDRIDGLDRRIADLQVTVAGRRSDVEDADYSKLILELNVHDTVYQASLAVTARLARLSLANFLG